MQQSWSLQQHRRNPVTLELLEQMPCGCVFAAYRAQPSSVVVFTSEARGKYCPNEDHNVGLVVKVIGLEDFESEYVDE